MGGGGFVLRPCLQVVVRFFPWACVYPRAWRSVARWVTSARTPQTDPSPPCFPRVTQHVLMSWRSVCLTSLLQKPHNQNLRSPGHFAILDTMSSWNQGSKSFVNISHEEGWPLAPMLSKILGSLWLFRISMEKWHRSFFLDQEWEEWWKEQCESFQRSVISHNGNDEMWGICGGDC